MKGIGLKVLVAATVLGLCSGNASAIAIDTLLSTGGQQTLSDDSAEEQSVDINGNGRLDVGDELRGIFEITKVNTTAIGKGTSFDELTGIYGLVVASKDAVPGAFRFTFAPSSGFQAVYGTGAVIAMFEDSSQDFMFEGTSLNAAILTATGGRPYWTLGFQTTDDFWQATMSRDDFVALGTLPVGTPVGRFDFGLHLLTNLSGKNLASEPCVNAFTTLTVAVEACGSGNLTATGGVSVWDLYDPLQIGITTVPEPGTLTLLGIGMAAFGARARRRSA